MGYVMVPVPEEHVEEAMQIILRITSRSRLEDWDAETVTTLFHEVDEPSRSVLSAVARGTAETGSVADQAVADSIEFTQREVLGIVRELNERAGARTRPSLVMMQQEIETLPNGRTRERRKLSMDPMVAQQVKAAEQAELQAAPHPLLSEDG